MAFSFDKFVQRSTRGLFAFIVVVMVVPLVLWGYMGKQGNEREEDKGEAGVIYDTIKISKAEYNRDLTTAAVSWWVKKLNDPMVKMMMQYYRQMPPPPKPEELAKQAWEDIILLREAKAAGIQASEQENLMQLRDVFQTFTGRPDYNDDQMAQLASGFFHITMPTLHVWLAEHVLREKLLTLVSDSEFADYDKIYDRVANGRSMAKAWYAAFDPKDYLRELKPPTTDEIAGYYQKNKDKYKMAAKAQVAYLLADAEEIAKKEPEPSEDAIKKYYEEFKVAEFAKPHAHEEGEGHKEGEKTEFKSFEEVKAEIPAKIKRKAADKAAAQLMSDVDVALGAIATANDNKYPDNVFDQLYAKFKDRGIVHDITNSFDAKQVEDIEKSVGANSNLATWAFDLAQKPGDVSQKVRTSKGVALFRLQTRKDAQEPGISDRVRESIVKELQKEQLKKRVQQVANNVVLEISTHGMMAARLKYPVDWRVTRYFKTDSPELGIEDSALATAIQQQVRGTQMKPGKASTMSGTMLRSPEKAEWVYVVYLEDLVDLPPDDAAAQFAGQRKEMDEEARRKYRQVYIDDTVKLASVKLDPSLKNSEKPAESSPNP
ncbi:MAG TPA: hypothetical protein VE981_02175 [Planctomycetota bacterium]|nr:hypothetical protein [Planctomycetota bacterium]